MRAARPAFVLRYKKPAEVSAKRGGSQGTRNRVLLQCANAAPRRILSARQVPREGQTTSAAQLQCRGCQEKGSCSHSQRRFNLVGWILYTLPDCIQMD